MISLKPTSFFELNASNDVPRSNQKFNQSKLDGCETSCPRSLFRI